MKFADFSGYLAKIEATASRNEMTAILVKLLKKAGAGEVKELVYLSLGRIAPLHREVNFNLAEKMMLKAIARAFNKNESEILKTYKKNGDLGITAAHLSPHPPDSLDSPEISSVFKTLTGIALESGEDSQERKLNKTAELLKRLNPLGARYAVRIILGKLRLGFSDKTILDALSFFIAGDKSARKRIEAAYNVRPDVGVLAEEIKSARIPRFPQIPQLGVPVIPALCQRLPNAEEIVKKMGRPAAGGRSRASTSAGAGVAVEPKWDGQRIQAHIQKSNAGGKNSASNINKIHLFTRSLEDVTPMFPDLTDALSAVPAASAILDGEAVAVNPQTGKISPFQTMITRKRKYGVAEKLKNVPIRYMIFDILELNGKSLLQEPFYKRRKILETLLSPAKFPNFSKFPHSPVSLAPQITTAAPASIRRFLKQQIDNGLEGIVAKRADAPYVPGRTKFAWVKLKWEGKAKAGGLLDTIDGVVMGTYAGRGKRAGFGVGAFLVGIASPNFPISFLTISKIGTGLTDEQWKKLQAASNKLQVTRPPKEYEVPKELAPDAWLKPEIVAEIQADNITKSPLHSAGYALRFPRLVRYRPDKKPAQATTKREIEKLYEMQ